MKQLGCGLNAISFEVDSANGTRVLISGGIDTTAQLRSQQAPRRPELDLSFLHLAAKVRTCVQRPTHSSHAER